MTGHLFLVCAADAEGRSFLREQSFCAPMHISKPFTESGALVVNVVNPTAGFLQGDSVTCEVRVESGARLVLTSPSASRIHHSGDGCARLEQNFTVEENAFLEVNPELFIPQRGARYEQTTAISVESGGELIFFETLAPGRVAMGEAFEFARLDWKTDVRWDGTLAVRERYALSPDDESLAALRCAFPQSYYASCFAFGESFLNAEICWREIATLHSDRVWIGCSPATAGGCVVKIVATDSPTLRRVLAEVRRNLYAALGRAAPEWRRV